MKREIKFRAWLPEHYDEPQNWSMVYDLAFEDFEPINDLLASVDHLMQFTGLTDRDGNEIYEGDIIGWEYYFDSEKIKEFSVVCWDKENTCFDFGDYRRPRFYPRMVVGNVYENPELLKGD